MQHNNNIENKLREMEAMEQPNLGQMDDHWQQMAGMLQPAALPLKKGWPKWMLNTLSAVAVVVLIGVALVYLSSKKNNEGEKNNKQFEGPAKENAAANIFPSASLPTVTDSAVATNTNVAFHQPTINASLVNHNYTVNVDAKQWTEEDSLLGTVKLNVAPCGNCDDTTDGAIVSSAERQLKLQTLFAQLEKHEQYFTVDNSRDTLLKFEEGTVLLVPANSFGGMNSIEIAAKEFYKTSDIVLNQLNTASNKEQLETAGMLKLNASYKGKELSINKPLVLFMPDTTNSMLGMQLFYGGVNEAGKQAASAIGVKETAEENKIRELQNGITRTASLNTLSFVNWVPQNQYFMRNQLVTEVWVLNLIDEPFEVHYPFSNTEKKTAYFVVSDSIAIEKKKLKQLLKEKYGYHKVRLRGDFRNWFKEPGYDRKNYYRDYATRIGDSLWMLKSVADKHGLKATKTRQYMVGGTASSFVARNSMYGSWVNLSENSEALTKEISNRFSININTLGWINCDRFYADSRKKIDFKVDLGDSASNYYTMLVFEKINSMMTGYINGNTVAFPNIPIGETVKIISIGINKKGETVYSVTHTTTSEEVLKGLQFQSTSAPDLRTALSKYDK